MKEDLLKLRSESSTLYTSTHEQEKMLTQLQTRVAVLEQELKDKQQVRQVCVVCSEVRVRVFSCLSGDWSEHTAARCNPGAEQNVRVSTRTEGETDHKVGHSLQISISGSLEGED